MSRIRLKMAIRASLGFFPCVHSRNLAATTSDIASGVKLNWFPEAQSTSYAGAIPESPLQYLSSVANCRFIFCKIRIYDIIPNVQMGGTGMNIRLSSTMLTLLLVATLISTIACQASAPSTTPATPAQPAPQPPAISPPPSSPPPQPAPPLPPPPSVKLTDTTNDLFDRSGNAASGEPYMDILVR